MKGMTNTEIFFCDTYALIEIVGGNPSYKKYLSSSLITSDYNLMEMYYAFLRDCWASRQRINILTNGVNFLCRFRSKQ